MTEQRQTEIVCRTVRRRFTIHRGHCRQCGASATGRHPLQTSTATGAAGEQLGPKVHALMSVLNKRLGAWAQSVLMSVIGTCLLRRIDPLNFFIEALTSPSPILLAQPPP